MSKKVEYDILVGSVPEPILEFLEEWSMETLEGLSNNYLKYNLIFV